MTSEPLALQLLSMLQDSTESLRDAIQDHDRVRRWLIHTAREEGITHQTIADAAGLSKQRIAQILNGETTP